MSTPPEQFARIAGKVDLDELGSKLVVIVGVGSLGSQIAKELAHSGVGHLRFIDGDRLDETNVIRHGLPRRWVGDNKAEALTLFLSGEVPTLEARGLDRDIDDDLTDMQLDDLLGDADLIVAATDDRRAQRRVNACARRLDKASLSPGLYENDGGEVFVQWKADLPCFSCWDEFRSADVTLRAAVALNVDTLPILFLTVELCLGLLDRRSIYFRRLVGRPGEQVPLLYRLAVRDEVVLGIAALEKRPDCPVCGDSGGAPPPFQTQVLASRPVVPTAGPLSSIALWALLIAFVGFGMSFGGAYMARHEVGYPGSLHEFLPMTGYLLELAVATGVAALAAVGVTELLSLQSGEPPGRYSPAIMLKWWPLYALTPIAALGVLAAFKELQTVSLFIRLGPDTPASPFWWWLFAPALVCVVHVIALTIDRWQARASLSVLLIPMAALCGVTACGLLFGWPLPTPGPQG